MTNTTSNIDNAAQQLEAITAGPLDRDAHTGGGCTAWMALLSGDWDGAHTYIMATVADGCDAPTTDVEAIMLGRYSVSADGEEVTSEYVIFEDALHMAICLQESGLNLEWER